MARWTLSVMAAVLLAMLAWSAWWEGGWKLGGYSRCDAQVLVGRGQIILNVQRFTQPLPAAIAAQSHRGFWCQRHDGRMHWRPAYEQRRSRGTLHRSVYIPIWMPLVLVASAAGYFWRPKVRRRRRDRIIKAGGCPHCGYDLRGLNAQGETQGEGTEPRAVCPECGK